MADHARALVVGATGQIGRAAVHALVADGWEVTAASRGGGRDARWPREVRTLALDRDEPEALAAAVGEGVGLLVDVTAMSGEHARQLAALAGRVGSAVVLSSAAVYVDARGRAFGAHSDPGLCADYPVPVTERQPTLEPGEGYGAQKVLLERELLALGKRLPVTLLRAGAVHGPHCRTPRELYFVKRWLDGRPVRVLAHGGESRFQPVHVDNVAELVRLAARRPASRVLNAGDPTAPTVAEIARAVDAAVGWECETVLLEGAPPAAEPSVGRTPWSLPKPLVFDMAAAEAELGYRPVTTYEESLPRTVEWLAATLRGRDWRVAFPEMAAAYEPTELFAYDAEDRWLAGRRA